MSAPRCSIVIATRNRAATLLQTLTRLAAASNDVPIVVVDNGSIDGSAHAVRARHPDVTVIGLAENRGAAARTVGVRRCATPYVAFCDDDSWWESGAVQRGSDLLDSFPGVALLNARVLVNDLEELDAACRLMASSELSKKTACPGTAIAAFLAGACMVRRDAFLQAGGYHERYLIGAEESLLALDLLARGWEMLYVEELVVHHFPASSERDPQRRRRLVMRNRLWTAWLRNSPRHALDETLRTLASARTDPEARAALRAAVGGLPWILRERRPVARELERRLARVTELPA
ncbi:MAG: glycosyltransferase family 2 protein [Candidatus Velthaea sp.]